MGDGRFLGRPDSRRLAGSSGGERAERRIRRNFDFRLRNKALNLADAGLKARKCPGAGGLVPDESHFLDALKEILSTGVTPAGELLANYYGRWNRDLNRIYDEYSY